MNTEEYLSDLSSQLHVRGVAEDRIKEIVGEVMIHLEESGENAAEAFGPASDYAEQMAVHAEREIRDASDDQWHHRTFRATAFDEMEILLQAGKDGWELMDVGGYALFCRRPAVGGAGGGWEYVRRVGIDHNGIIEEMTADRWQPCGHWVVFHYFKRRVA